MGILPTRAGLLIDLFLLLLIALVPAMLAGVALARRRRLRAHGRVMKVCFVLFVAGLAGFEAWVRFGPAGPGLATVPLVIHLCVSVPCLLLWFRQILTAGTASAAPRAHRRRGLLLLALLAATLATGCWLYLATFA